MPRFKPPTHQALPSTIANLGKRLTLAEAKLAQTQSTATVGGGAAITFSASLPESASLDDLWYKTDDEGNILGTYQCTTAYASGDGSDGDWAPYVYDSTSIADSAITSTQLAADSVSTSSIQDNAVTTATIANSAVTTTQIASGTITGTNIASGTISGSNLTNGTITAAQIGSATITGSNIATGTITGSLLTSGTITATQIASAAITGSNIASATITGSLISSATITGSNIASATIAGSNVASGAITAANIANATITAAQISGSAAITGGQIASATITGSNVASGTISGSNIQSATISGSNIAAGTISGSNIASATISSTQIASGSITGSDIGSATITGANLANETISSTQIANGTITTTQISSSAGVTGTQIASGTVAGSNIAAGTVTASNIASGTITSTQIAASTIAAGNIVSGTITSGQIAAGTITASNIAANTITASQVAANTITGSQIAAGTISGVYTGAAYFGQNMIQDSQFSSSLLNAVRTGDPVTNATWTLSGGTAEVTAGAPAKRLALMPSASTPFFCTPGEQYYLQVTGVTSASCQVGIEIAFSNGTVSTVSATFSGTQTVSGPVAVPAGASSGYVRIFAYAGSGSPTATLSSPACYIGQLTGPDWILNQNGYYLYNGAPAAYGLVFSNCASAGTDPAGNTTLAGTTFYSEPTSGVMLALNMASGGITNYVATGYNGTYSAGGSAVNFFAAGGAEGLYLQGAPILAERGSGGFTGYMPITASDATTHSASTTTLAQLTEAWVIPSGDAAATTIYRLKAWGNSTLGSTTETMTWTLSINGDTTHSATATWGAAPITASKTYDWVLTCDVQVMTTGGSGTVQTTMQGAMDVHAANLGNTNTGGAIAAYAGSQVVATNAPFTIELLGAFGAAISGEVMHCYGSSIERLGA